jgi:hypothetical protein
VLTKRGVRKNQRKRNWREKNYKERFMTRMRLLLSRLVQGPVTSVHRSPEARTHGAERKTEEDKDRAASQCNKAERAAQPQPHSTVTVAAFRDAFFCRALSLSLGRGSKIQKRHGHTAAAGSRTAGRPLSQCRTTVSRASAPGLGCSCGCNCKEKQQKASGSAEFVSSIVR